MLSHRDRQLAAIRHEETDRVPVDAIGIENLAALAAYFAVPEDCEAILERLGIDGRNVAPWPYRGPRPSGNDGVQFTDWGTLDTGDYGTAHWYPLAGATSTAEIERYPWWPDPALYDYLAAAAAAQKLVTRYAIRAPYWKPLFCQVCDLLGMEQAMITMACEPALFEAALEKVFQHVYRFSELFLEACGEALDIYSLGDDFATQRGMMIDPEHWRRFLKPRYAQLFALAKSRGKYVWFHSCGDITAVLPDLLDIGVDVWETVQLHTLPISPAALKREYGQQLTFFGGINTQRLPFATPADVRTEVRQCIEVLGKGGGYICGPDHHIKPDVPAANAVALFAEATGEDVIMGT